MYSKILVGFKDTEQGRDALELGQTLARASAAEMLAVSLPGEDGRDLAQLARTEEADLVVLGSTHRGSLGRVIPGATVDRLLGEAPCTIAVAPPGFSNHADGNLGWRPLSGDDVDVGLRVIGVGYDGTHAAAEALKAAASLAVPNGAALRVYTVARRYASVPGGDGDSRGPGMPTEAEALHQALFDAVAKLPSEVRALPVFIRGSAAEELIDATRAGVDLLVLGSRSGGPVRRAFHHSISSAVMARVSCPVLISPSGVKAPEPALSH